MIGLFGGTLGASLSGYFDQSKTQEMLEGIGFGALIAALLLVPYWIYLFFAGDGNKAWSDIDNKSGRVFRLVLATGFIAYIFSSSLGV